MSCKKMMVGSVATLVLLTAGFGFGYAAKSDTPKLEGLLNELLKVQKETLSILREKQKRGEVSMPDLIQAEIDALQTEFELCHTEEERIKTLKRMEVVFADWEVLADRGLKNGALTMENYLRIKAKRIGIQIDVEKQHLLAEQKK